MNFKATSDKSIDLLKENLSTEVYTCLINNTDRDNKDNKVINKTDDISTLYTYSENHIFEIDRKIEQIENDLLAVKKELYYADKCSCCNYMCSIQ